MQHAVDVLGGRPSATCIKLSTDNIIDVDDFALLFLAGFSPAR